MKIRLTLSISLLLFFWLSAADLKEIRIAPASINNSITLNGIVVGDGSIERLIVPDTGCYIVTEQNEQGINLYSDTICGGTSSPIRNEPQPNQSPTDSDAKVSRPSSQRIENSEYQLSIGAGLLFDHLSFAPSVRFGIYINRKRYFGVQFSYMERGNRDDAETLPESPNLSKHNWYQFYSLGVELERAFTPHKPFSFLMGAFLGTSSCKIRSSYGEANPYRDQIEHTLAEEEYRTLAGFRIGIEGGGKRINVRLTADARLAGGSWSKTDYSFNEETRSWEKGHVSEPFLFGSSPVLPAAQFSVNYLFGKVWRR